MHAHSWFELYAQRHWKEIVGHSCTPQVLADLSPLPKWISFSLVIIKYKQIIKYFILSKYWINLVRLSLHCNCVLKERDKKFNNLSGRTAFCYCVYFVFLNYLVLSLLKHCKEYLCFLSSARSFSHPSENGQFVSRNMHN